MDRKKIPGVFWEKLQNFLFGRLYMELLLAVLFSLGMAFGIFWICQKGLYAGSDYILDNTQYESENNREKYAELQEFVQDKGLASTDYTALSRWCKRRQPLSFGILEEGRVVYDSDWGEIEAGQELWDYAGWYMLYTLEFADGAKQVYFEAYPAYKLYALANYFSLGLGGLFFVLFFTKLIQRKIGYIYQIQRGIRCLEQGDLHYEIPCKGRDEIGHLATALNDMRRALHSQITEKQRAFAANRDLITALSHDLRTPLTTQMAYLEMLGKGRFRDGQERDKYLEKAISTCGQIKDMSDRLFEYFMVFDKENLPISHLETVDALALFGQFVEEYVWILEEESFSFSIQMPEEGHYPISVSTAYMSRIFDNIFSNIRKYGDNSQEVRLRVQVLAGKVLFHISNGILEQPSRGDSAKIGLKNVEKMMDLQGGRFRAERQGERFCLYLAFPLAGNGA